MLSKKLKLPIKEFPKRSTLYFKGEKLSIKRAHNKHTYPRIGVLVSKKVSPKATTRNFIKRTIYDFLGERLETIPGGVDLLVVVGGHIIETSSDTKSALRKELEKGLKALN